MVRGGQMSLRANTIAPRRRALRSPTQRRHPAISMATSIDCAGLAASGARTIVLLSSVLASLPPRLTALGRAASQNIVGRVRPPYFAGADVGGLEHSGAHPFRTRRDSPRRLLRAIERVRSRGAAPRSWERGARPECKAETAAGGRNIPDDFPTRGSIILGELAEILDTGAMEHARDLNSLIAGKCAIEDRVAVFAERMAIDVRLIGLAAEERVERTNMDRVFDRKRDAVRPRGLRFSM